MTNYRLGMFDENAYVHGMDVVKDMRDATGKIRGDTHFVVVAVYADGYLQFAGADATLNIPIDRLMTKQVAQMILGRMESHGEIDIEKAPAPSTGNTAELREACEKMLSLLMLRGDGKAYCTLSWDEFNDCQKMLRAALAKPSRNCDVGTVEEQMYRFRSHCDRQGDCVECSIRQETIGRALFCGIVWSQKPYEEKGGAK